MQNNQIKRQSFQYGATVLLVSSVIANIIGALFKIPLGWNSVLGDLGFGYFSSAYDLFSPVYSLSMAGLPIAVSRIVSEQITEQRYKDARQTFKISKNIFTILGFILLIVILIFTFFYYSNFKSSINSIYPFIAIAPSVLFCCILSSYRGYYEGLGNMFPTSISDIIMATCKLVFGLLTAFICIKLTGNIFISAIACLAGISFGTLITNLYLKLHLKKYGDLITEEQIKLSPSSIQKSKATKNILYLTVPIALSSLANDVSLLVDALFVKWQLGRVISNNSEAIRNMYNTSITSFNNISNNILSDEQIPIFLYGIRGKAFTIYNLVPTFTVALGISALPVLTSVYVSNQKELLKKNVDSMLKFISIIAFPCGIGLFVSGNRIMKLLYGTIASVEIGGRLLSLFGIASIFSGFAIPLISMLQAVNKQKIALFNIAIGLLLKISFCIILVGIPQINIKGVPYSTIICYLYISISNFIVFIKTIKIKVNIINSFFKPFISSIFCGVVFCLFCLTGDSSIITISGIFIALIVYLFSIFILKTFDKTEINKFLLKKENNK